LPYANNDPASIGAVATLLAGRAWFVSGPVQEFTPDSDSPRGFWGAIGAAKATCG